MQINVMSEPRTLITDIQELGAHITPLSRASGPGPSPQPEPHLKPAGNKKTERGRTSGLALRFAPPRLKIRNRPSRVVRLRLRKIGARSSRGLVNRQLLKDLLRNVSQQQFTIIVG